MRNPEQFSEITSHIPLFPNLAIIGVVVLAAWAVLWFLAGVRHVRREK